MHISETTCLASCISFSLPLLFPPLPSTFVIFSFCICLCASLCLYSAVLPVSLSFTKIFSVFLVKTSTLLFKTFSFLNLDEKAGALINIYFFKDIAVVTSNFCFCESVIFDGKEAFSLQLTALPLRKCMRYSKGLLLIFSKFF